MFAVPNKSNSRFKNLGFAMFGGRPWRIQDLFANASADSGGLYTPNPLQYQTSVGGDPADDPAEPVGLVLSKLGNQQVGGTGINPSQPTAGSRVANASVPVGAIRNRLSNNMMTGAATGAPGTLPASWVVTGGLGTLTRTLTVGARANGNPFLRIRLNGTTSTTSYGLRFSATGTGAVPSPAGADRTGQVTAGITGGDLSNISALRFETLTYQADGTFIGGFNQVSLPSGIESLVSSGTMGVNTAFATPGITVLFDSGVEIDVTFEIELPQFENGAVATDVQQVTSLYQITEASVPSIDCYRMDSDWMTYGTGAFGSATAGFRATAADNWTVWLAWSTFTNSVTLFSQTNDGDEADRMLQVLLDVAGNVDVNLAGQLNNNLALATTTGAWRFASIRCTAGVVQFRYGRTAAATLTVGAAAAEAVNINAWARLAAGTPATIFTGYGLLPEFIPEAISDTEWDQLTSYWCDLLRIPA